MKHVARSTRPRPSKPKAGAPISPLPVVPWLTWAMGSGLFRSEVAATWFLREHKRELVREDVALKITRTWHAVVPGIEPVVLKILKRNSLASVSGAERHDASMT